MNVCVQDGGLGMHGECMPAGQEFGPGVEDKFGDKVAHAASGQETTSRVIVCNAAHTHASISMFYPPQLASFFTDKVSRPSRSPCTFSLCLFHPLPTRLPPARPFLFLFTFAHLYHARAHTRVCMRDLGVFMCLVLVLGRGLGLRRKWHALAVVRTASEGDLALFIQNRTETRTGARGTDSGAWMNGQALLKAFEHDGFLGSKLGADVGEIRFLEWRQSSVL